MFYPLLIKMRRFLAGSKKICYGRAGFKRALSMIPFSYTMTRQVSDNLREIENLRVKILIVPLSHSNEVVYRWRMFEKKVMYSLRLADTSLSAPDMRRLIGYNPAQKQKELTFEEQKVIDYRISLDYIKQYWYVSKKRITIRGITLLNNLATGGKLPPDNAAPLKELLDYLEFQDEHPALKAAIGLIQINTLRPFNRGNELTARLFTHLLLDKYGFDVRGSLTPEVYWHKNRSIYERLSRLSDPNITPWLEFFCVSIRSRLEKAYQILSDVGKEQFVKRQAAGFFTLNDRQRYILTLLDEPLATITNQKVQERFKISQITASRDLSKLATLGLLFAHGKGRSVYYTKV
jgi:hypothetical protein